MACEFNEAWRGTCKKPTEDGERFCNKHLGKMCAECGKQGNHECDFCGMLVCGQILCEDHRTCKYHY